MYRYSGAGDSATSRGAQQTPKNCITFVQRLRHWADIVQMLYKQPHGEP